MIVDHIATQIYAKFSFEPTPGQKKIIEMLARWIAADDPYPIFILNGYAGTGKTTIISALVGALKQLKIKPVILAPTGRAAKVAGSYSSEKAHTIHKRIYRQRSLAAEEASFVLDQNKESDACFIVDEASMLSNDVGAGNIFGSGALLDDLVKYVAGGKRCRLMLVGDDAQLPPVGLDRSPALDPDYMRGYGDVVYGSLDQVVRQSAGSGILAGATLVRGMLAAGDYSVPKFDLGYPDVRRIGGGEILEEIEGCYATYGRGETMVVTRSNKRANRFNEGIRRHVLSAEEEIGSGDRLMIVRNNYHYTERLDGFPMDFVANGDTATLERIFRLEDLYGFRFAQARLGFGDYDDAQLECRIMLDTLNSESPSLTHEQGSRLFHAVAGDYADVKSKARRYRQVRENPHFNALQVKFAYSVTCHKAQGGQWRAVFVDRMLFGDEQMTRDLLRWLYTALTRATERLYFVNFDDEFFSQT